MRSSGLVSPQLKATEELGSDGILEAEPEALRLSPCTGRDSPSDLKQARVTEENGEQEGEPLRNGAESISEGEGGDASSACMEGSGETPTCQYKPRRSCVAALPPGPSLLEGRDVAGSRELTMQCAGSHREGLSVSSTLQGSIVHVALSP